MRLFVALDVGEDDRRALAGWARETVGDDDGLRLVAQEQLHLTLAFLGHRPAAEIERLSDAVASFAGRPAPVLHTGPAMWLSPRRPQVLTVAVGDDDGALAELHAALWRRLAALGHERERRALMPHVTVARVRRGAAVAARALPDPPARRLRVEALVLVRSHLGGGAPARYETQARAGLSAGS